MTAPRVSVICIFFNEEQFLAQAVATVLAQDFADYELLLVDDGSNDGSAAIAQSCAANDSRVRLIEHPKRENRGRSAARNLGAAHARGEFLAFLDGDDVWRPQKLREQVALIDSRPELGMVCGPVHYWGRWSGGEDRLVLSAGLADAISYPPATSLRVYPLGGTEAPLPSDALLRRNLFEHVGGFVEAFTGLYDDHVFFAKVFLAAPVWFSSRVWTDYRQHPGSCCALASDAEVEAARRAFLTWFADYLGHRSFAGESSLRRAIARAWWKLDHPRVMRQVYRMTRLKRMLVP